jgi:hypothetical protein
VRRTGQAGQVIHDKQAIHQLSAVAVGDRWQDLQKRGTGAKGRREDGATRGGNLLRLNQRCAEGQRARLCKQQLSGQEAHAGRVGAQCSKDAGGGCGAGSLKRSVATCSTGRLSGCFFCGWLQDEASGWPSGEGSSI